MSNSSDNELFRLPGRTEAVTALDLMTAVRAAMRAAQRTACRRLGIDDSEARYIGLSITSNGSHVSLTGVAPDGRAHVAAAPVLVATA